MRAMGFRPFAVGETITAAFTSISVYEARGISLQSEVPQIESGSVMGGSYTLGLGSKLNEACFALAGDVYVGDESAWMKEVRASGPFLLIQVGPTIMHTITSGQIKAETDGSVTTYESFTAAALELAEIEATVLPRLVTSLTCSLVAPEHYLELRKLDRSSLGRMTTGQALRDTRILASASGYSSRQILPELAAASLRATTMLAPRLSSKAARFFSLGTTEEDELKKFLYFFLALEVETHAVFSQIDHPQAISMMLDPNSKPLPATISLLQRQADQLRNLFDRFVWNAACAWGTISEADVQQFKELKAIRDNIAHGTISGPPSGTAVLAQRLTRKVLAQHP